MRKLFSLFLDLIYPNKRFSVSEKLLFGARVFLYSDQHTGRKIRLSLFERNETKFLKNFVKNDFVCLDIGSNVGYYSVLFASKGAEVHSFDPVRENHAILTLTAALNMDLAIHAHHCAVGDKAGLVEFYVPKQTSYSRMQSNEKFETEDRRTVELITIDQLELPRVDVIKIDVEGAEEKVIKGMTETLARCRPKLVMIELVEEHLLNFATTVDAVFEHLAARGMVPMVLKGTKLFPYQSGRAKNDNFFFVPGSEFSKSNDLPQ